MPHPCCVLLCRGNYKNTKKVSVFSFPTNAELKEKWLRAIKRENFESTKHSKVCEEHFLESDIQRSTSAYDEKTGKLIEAPLKFPRLLPGVVPSVLPNLPAHFSSTGINFRESPDARKERKEMSALKLAIDESIKTKEDYNNTRGFSSFQELLENSYLIPESKWTEIKTENQIVFLLIDIEPVPKVKCSLTINSNLEAKIFLESVELHSLKNYKFPLVVNDVNTIIDILNELKNVAESKINNYSLKSIILIINNLLNSLNEHSNKSKETIKFLGEQISHLGNNKHGLRYSAEMMVFSTLLFTISPSAYRFLRKSGNIIMPHPNTIHGVCFKYISPQLEQCNSNFLFYVKQKFKYLDSNDRVVILMLDEIHIKEYFDYKGGNVVGMSYDSETCASTAHVFMIKSLLSKYKDVVHILPVSNISGEILHNFLKRIIGLEQIGFMVICVVTDNNSINRKAVSHFLNPPKFQFVYPHPVNAIRPLFFLIDTVHLLKCTRNNWLNQKNDDKCFFYPQFGIGSDISVGKNFKTASFSTLKKLHNLESNNLVKYGFKLSLKALAPSNMEKQNVALVLQIFNEFVAQGLIELGIKNDLPHYQQTADFITIITTWWQIVNVKSPSKGRRLNNDYQYPLTIQTSHKSVSFLKNFIEWLDAWKAMKCDTGMFTRETHSAFKLTTESILQILDYCTSELNLKYILPGKFQTDDLESRFGFYRQLAGCQYNISTRQIFECEKKLRMQSLLYLQIPTKSFGCVNVKDFKLEDNYEGYSKIDYDLFSTLKILPNEIVEAESNLPVIVYLSGYCAFTVLKKNSCKSCVVLHLLDKTLNLPNEYEYVKNLDRGGLSFPKKHVIYSVLYNYIIVKKLCTLYESDFVKQQNQRCVVATLTINLLEEHDLLGNEEVCSEGHGVEKFLKMVIWASSNIFLNNYTKLKNDALTKVQRDKKIEKIEKNKKNSEKVQTDNSAVKTSEKRKLHKLLN